MMFSALAFAAAILLSPDWAVEIREGTAWREVPTRLVPFGAGIGQVSNRLYEAGFDGLETATPMVRAALCELEWTKDLRVRVSYRGAAEELSVSPQRTGYGPFSGRTAELEFPKPAKLLVRADRNNVSALSLLVSPRPMETDETGFRQVIRFTAGYHDAANDSRIGLDAYGAPVVTVTNDDTLVRLEKGARVCAAIDIRGGARNVKVVGPGTIDLLARLPYFDAGFGGEMPCGAFRRGVLPAVYVHENAAGVTIRNLTILSDFRGVNMRNARGVVMDNVNVFTSVINGDGVNTINTEDLLAVNCYIRSQDDAWCAYNACDSIRWLWDPPEFCRTRRCRNLRCVDSFLMTNCRTVVLGGHASGNDADRDVVEDVEVAHCTLLEAKGAKASADHQVYWSGMLRILSQGGQIVRDVRFRDLDAEWGVNFSGQPVHMCVRDAGETSYGERGGYAIRNVLFEDVRFLDAPDPLPLAPYFAAPERGEAGFGIRDVVFRNVTVNGRGIDGCGRDGRGRVTGVRYE